MNPLTYPNFKLGAVWLPVRRVNSLPVRKVLFCLILHMQDQCTATEVGQFLVKLLQETDSWMLFLLIFSVMDLKRLYSINIKVEEFICVSQTNLDLEMHYREHLPVKGLVIFSVLQSNSEDQVALPDSSFGIGLYENVLSLWERSCSKHHHIFLRFWIAQQGQYFSTCQI